MLTRLPTPARRRRPVTGFTLMEMLIVLGIIGLLMGILAVGFGGIGESSAEQVAEIFVKQSVKAPLQAYKMSMGTYPTTDEGLNALLDKPSNDRASHWKGPYVDTIPLDPWNNHYQYRYPGTHNTRGYDLWSNGPDGVAGNADDIGNWQQ